VEVRDLPPEEVARLLLTFLGRLIRRALYALDENAG
jgi:hypothetical protein